MQTPKPTDLLFSLVCPHCDQGTGVHGSLDKVDALMLCPHCGGQAVIRCETLGSDQAGEAMEDFWLEKG